MSMNQLKNTMDTFDSFFSSSFQGVFSDWGQRQSLSVEQDGEVFHVSNGETGFTLAQQELEQLRHLVDVALMEADDEC